MDGISYLFPSLIKYSLERSSKNLFDDSAYITDTSI